MYRNSSDSAHVILIDDNEQAQAYLTTLLSRRGYIVHQAVDPSRGFELLQHLDFPTTVILNFKMQREHGNFIELVRNTNLDYQPYILILLDEDADSDVTSAYEAGADDFLLYNTEPRVLFAKLRAADRAIDIQIDLYEQNNQLEERTMSLERTLDLAGVLLFEEAFETGECHILFEPEVVPDLPLGLEALTSACVDEINREKIAQLETLNKTIVFEVSTPNGESPRWIEQKTIRNFYHDDSDKVVSRLSIIRDISDYYRVVAQRDLALKSTQSALEELEQARDRQTRMFAVIGHELRTPLSAMRMIARDEPELLGNHPKGELFDKLLDDTLDILSNLKNVAKPPSESPERVETRSVAALLEETVASLNSFMHEEKCTLILDLSASCAHSYALPVNALRRVVLNLVKNAALHSGGTTVWLDARVVPKNSGTNELQVEIADDGKGIDPEEVETLFEAFVRGNTERDGTGLGLMIVRSLIEDMNGSISYHEREEGGSIFAFSLPLESPKSVDSLTTAIQNEEGNTQFADVKVLLAEDNPTINDLTTRLLQSYGASVFSAQDGEEALQLFSEHEFDVVVTDIFMPKKDGIELTRELRNMGFTGLIVGVSAATLGEETNDLIAAGADSALEKPFTNTMLLEIIKLHWARRDAQIAH